MKVRCSTSVTNFSRDFGESHNLGCLETLKCDRHTCFMKQSVGNDHSCEGFRCYGIDEVDKIHVVSPIAFWSMSLIF